MAGITISRFQLDVICVDGHTDTVRGAVDDAGNFSADVGRCIEATVRFTGFTGADEPALLGSTPAAITQATTELVFETIRVGTVTFTNDAGYDSVCQVTTPEETDLGQRFELNANATKTLVLPVVNTTLVCIPLTDCADVGTCSLTGATATRVRTVAVPWGDQGTLSLQNLTNTLVFALAPLAGVVAGAVWSPFTVQLLNDAGALIVRSDITVKLVPSSTSTVNGGFLTGDSIQLASGTAAFSNVSFATASDLTFYRDCQNVNGVLLSTPPAAVSVLADVVALLTMTGPDTLPAGQILNVTVSATDRFNNPQRRCTGARFQQRRSHQSVPTRLDTTVGEAIGTAGATFTGATGFVLYTVGQRTVTATDASDLSSVLRRHSP